MESSSDPSGGVVQASAPKSRVPKPRCQLLAFERLHDIAPDEVRHVIKSISIHELRFYDCISESFLVEEGNYMIFVGSSSEEIPLYDTIDNQDLPVVFNLNVGHAMPGCIIPFGLMAFVDVQNQSIRFVD